MKWKNLTDKCKNCQWLKVFSLFMDGDHEYSCGHDPNCMRENGWSRKASTTETSGVTVVAGTTETAGITGTVRD